MKVVQSLAGGVLAALLLSAGCFGAAPSDEGCGDGEVQSGETCDGDCPTACDDANPCTEDSLRGSAEACTAVCEYVSITVCDNGASDACCPNGCNAGSDLDCSNSCGDGTVDPGETCDGNCPTACDDLDACTTDTLTGSVANCTAACASTPIAVCNGGDGCCPSSCDSGSDSDCSPTCGNGELDAGETCDSDCPTACDDLDTCTTDTLTGSVSNCTAACIFTAIAVCGGGDACCPATCDFASDSDCSPTCGNGEIDADETCDGDCPTACDDGEVCTTDTLIGSVANCNAACTTSPISACAGGDGCCPNGCNAGDDADCPTACGNGYVDIDETCDGDCPFSCDDGQACTIDTSSGSAGNCDLTCLNLPLTACSGGDSCCPGTCNAGSDSDCPTACGNSYVDIDETCDGNCPASCDDGQACTTDSSSGSVGNCDLVCTSLPVVTCIGGDGCCPGTCTNATDSDCSSGPCATIADVRAAVDGPVSLDLCPALVTYVSDLSYTLQVGPTGPAVMVYEGFTWIPDVAVGDEIRLRVSEVSTYHGLKEIILHDPVQLVSPGNTVSGLAQNLSPGVPPSEALESELVRVNGATVTAVDNLNLTVSYGTASGVTFRVDATTTYGFCVGATFDFFGLSTDYDGHRLQSFSDIDISNFNSVACPSLGRAPVVGDLVINEVLADPPATLIGDANCDGIRDTTGDEFVEFVNVSPDTLDLTGITLSDAIALRHTFLAVSLPPGEVVVVFGGGAPACGWASNVQVHTASGLGLNNAGDTITLRDGAGTTLAALTYPDIGVAPGDADTSLTLEPDLNTGGSYVHHNLTSSGLLFSPGNKIDGTSFP